MAVKSQRYSAGISARLRVVGLAAIAAVLTAAAHKAPVTTMDIFMECRREREDRKSFCAGSGPAHVAATGCRGNGPSCGRRRAQTAYFAALAVYERCVNE